MKNKSLRTPKPHILAALFLLSVTFAPLSTFAQWEELGGLKANGEILAICIDPSGNVYACGQFTDAPVSYAGYQYVAKWNGTSWSKLGTGVNALDTFNGLNALCADHSGNIYAAGVVTDSGWQVAKWNGTTWSTLGGTSAGLNANMGFNTLCTDASGTNIYAAGDFTDANGNYYVARWNGSSWSELGGGFNGSITTICTDPAGNVYAAGNFMDTYGMYAVAKWNGSSWSELGYGFSGFLYSLCSDPSGNVYVVGYFGDYVAKWNGSAWNAIGGYFSDIVFSIASDASGNIYAGGDFFDASLNEYVAKWNGSSWTEMGIGINALKANGRILPICADAHGNVFAGGQFKDAGGSYYVAKYNPYTAVPVVHQDELKAYPNPTTGSVTIQLPQTSDAATISVTDVSGRIVQAQTIPAGSGSITVDLGKVPEGIYLLQVISSAGSYRGTIAVRK